MINLWKSSYIFINIKCSYRNWHKIVKTVSSLQFHMFPLLTGWEPYIQTMQQVRSTGQIFFSNRAPVDLNTYIYIDVQYEDCLFCYPVCIHDNIYIYTYIYIYGTGPGPCGPPPPPQWYGSKTYILATFSWNPQKHMVFTMFWRARPPKPWYLQRFVILPLYTTTHIVLLLCINPHSRSPHLPPTGGRGNILDTT